MGYIVALKKTVLELKLLCNILNLKTRSANESSSLSLNGGIMIVLVVMYQKTVPLR